jgi:hypothetical protein
MKTLAFLALFTSTAWADRVAVRVVDTAGDTSYIEPSTGLARGMHVRIAGRDVAIVECTARSCSVHAPLPLGATGTADAQVVQAEAAEKLPAPRPLEAFKDQWPSATLPATTQHPDAVPLGETRARGANHLAIIGHLAGNLDKDGSGGQVEARVIGSFDRIAESPLGADVDAAIRLFGTGTDSGAKVPVFVRAAQLRWGDGSDPALVIGRLRYAATSVGMLDGGRAAVRVGRLELAAFGGIVPDPVSGAPDTGAARFGTEATYDAPGAWHPHVAAAVHGSTWDGRLDERRLSLAASANKDSTWLTGWAEAQLFDANNPWNAPAIDLTGAGASGEWRHRGRHLGLDVTFLRPERSLRLAAALPQSWLCATTDTTCSDFWVAATLSGGLAGAYYAIDAVGSLGTTQSLDSQGDVSGYVRGELGPRTTRAVIAVSGGHSAFSAWDAADLGVALAPSPRLDLSLTYRPERLDYAAQTDAFLLHNLVLDLRWSVSSAFDVAVSALGTTGADRDMLALLTTLAWRPLP